MYALWHRALALAVVLVAATATGWTQQVGVVSGRVTDESGVPMKDVEVTLSSPGIPGLMRTTTDQAGRYWFPAVPGNHPLTVEYFAIGEQINDGDLGMPDVLCESPCRGIHIGQCAVVVVAQNGERIRFRKKRQLPNFLLHLHMLSNIA